MIIEKVQGNSATKNAESSSISMTVEVSVAAPDETFADRKVLTTSVLTSWRIIFTNPATCSNIRIKTVARIKLAFNVRVLSILLTTAINQMQPARLQIHIPLISTNVVVGIGRSASFNALLDRLKSIIIAKGIE